MADLLTADNSRLTTEFFPGRNKKIIRK